MNWLSLRPPVLVALAVASGLVVFAQWGCSPKTMNCTALVTGTVSSSHDLTKGTWSESVGPDRLVGTTVVLIGVLDGREADATGILAGEAAAIQQLASPGTISHPEATPPYWIRKDRTGSQGLFMQSMPCVVYGAHTVQSSSGDLFTTGSSSSSGSSAPRKPIRFWLWIPAGDGVEHEKLFFIQSGCDGAGQDLTASAAVQLCYGLGSTEPPPPPPPLPMDLPGQNEPPVNE